MCVVCSKPHILWLTENYPPRRGGMAQACDRIVSGLRSSGIKVDVAFFNYSAVVFKTACQMNGRLIVVPASDSPAHSLNLLFNYISDPSNNLKYTHIAAFGGAIPMLALPVFKVWMGLKAVTLLRGNDFDIGVFQSGKRQILFDALKASDAVCVLYSEAVKRVSSLISDAKVFCIPNGIDTEDWQNDSFDYVTANNFRKENNIADNQLVVGLFGQLKEKKGVVFFFENLLKTGLQEKVTIITVGDVEPSLQAWIDKKILGKKESVETTEIENQEQVCEPVEPLIKLIQLPFMDRFELLSLYPVCDFIALPSHYDGMPNVLLEAGTLGIPAIAARTGGIAEVLPDQQFQLTFHPGNADQCRQALNRAFELSKEERKAIGQALKSNIENNFSQSNESLNYKKLFTTV